MKNHKYYELAKRAHAHTSFSPDKRAEDFCKGFDADVQKLIDCGVEEAKIKRYEKLTINWLEKKEPLCISNDNRSC